MKTIDLPEWNDLPEEVRVTLVREGEYWDAFIGGDMAHAIYVKLRGLLEGLNLDEPVSDDEPPLFLDILD